MNAPVPGSAFFTSNRLKLSARIPLHGAAFLFANDEMPRNGDQYFPYRQQSDFFYCTGIDQEKSILVLCPHHTDENLREILFIIKPDQNLETWQGKKLEQEEARVISGIKSVRYLEDFYSVMDFLAAKTESFWFNLPVHPKFKPAVQSRDQRMLGELRKLYPLHRMERISPVLEELRVRKGTDEIQCIRYACSVTGQAVLKVLHTCRPGIGEYDMEADITHAFISKRCRHAFYPIVAAGMNACTLHYTANSGICGDGSLVLFDIGAEWKNYASDCTRTIPVNGRFSPRQREVYESVLRMLQHATSLIKPGLTIEEINREMKPFMEEEHLRLGLYTRKELEAQTPETPLYRHFYMHGISHFIGLDVHDTGDKDIKLEPGMVLSCEPGIYIPAEGIGIRLENTLYITEDHAVNLMEKIPLLPDDIEDEMNYGKK